MSEAEAKEEANEAENEQPEEEEEDLFNADDEDDDTKNAGSQTAGGDTNEATTVKEEAPAEEPAVKEPPSEATAESPPVKAEETKMETPIPRVSVAAAPEATKESPPRGENSFGLPSGVTIPASVNSSILNGRLLETLRGLSMNLINDALAEYDDAVQIKGDSIRNRGAYLYGVIKRYVSVQERSKSGEGEAVLPMGPELTSAVNQRLAKLVSDNFCTEEEMNDKVKSKIRMLSENDALFAIEELASVDRTQIRNFGSYFMGILNRYMRGERKDLTSGKKTLAEIRQQFQSPQSNDRKRSRDRDGDQFRRDSNNRRQQTRYGMGARGNSHDFHDPYSQQNPPYGGPSMVPPQPSARNAYPNPQQVQNPYGPPQQQFGAPPMGGPGNQYGNQQMPLQRGPPSQYNPQQQQPPNGHGQPPPQNFVPQNPFGNSQQGGIPGLPPPPIRGNAPNSYGPPPGQAQYMNQLQQQSYGNSQYPPPPQASNRFSQPPGGQPGMWGTQAPTPAGAPALDILALADKASSAVQALQSQNKYHMLPHMQQQQNPQPPPFQQQAYGHPPMNNAPPSFSQPNQPYQQTPPLQGYGGVQQQQAQQKRRRTTATLAELPITVQYAVQNLQATGQINGPLDDGMLGMVKDLPEDLALQALQKFATIDKSTMRNKTAYLAGVLRRELEKIHRR